MSVDRGQKKLARQMAALVGPAKRTLYTVDASPGLNLYVFTAQRNASAVYAVIVFIHLSQQSVFC